MPTTFNPDLPEDLNGMSEEDQVAFFMRGHSSKPNNQSSDRRPDPRNRPSSHVPRTQEPKREPETKSPDINAARRESTAMARKIDNGYTHGIRMLYEFEIAQELSKYAGAGLAVADGVLSLWALSVRLNNPVMAGVIALGVGLLLFSVGISISLKSINDFLQVDQDEDGTTSWSEKFWFVMKVAGLLLAVATDIFTNYLGMDALGASTLVPANIIPGWVVALALATFIMIAPHLLIAVCDVNLKAIARRKPKANLEAGEIQADVNYSAGARRVLATKTRPIGEQEANKKAAGWKLGSRFGS